MGNCIHVVLSQNGAIRSCLKEKHENDQPVDAKVYSTPSWNPLYCGINCRVEKATMELSPPIPPKMMPDDDDAIMKPASPRSVKIVVTKKQLEKLVKSMKELEGAGSKVHLADNLWEDKRNRYKWRPSLATINE